MIGQYVTPPAQSEHCFESRLVSIRGQRFCMSDNHHLVPASDMQWRLIPPGLMASSKLITTHNSRSPVRLGRLEFVSIHLDSDPAIMLIRRGNVRHKEEHWTDDNEAWHLP